MEGHGMPTERLSLRRIRQVLQLHLVRDERACDRRDGRCRTSTVQDYLALAAAAGLDLTPLAPDLTDEALEQRLFPAPSIRPEPGRCHVEPDWPTLVREMKRPGSICPYCLRNIRTFIPMATRIVASASFIGEFERRLLSDDAPEPCGRR